MSLFLFLHLKAPLDWKFYRAIRNSFLPARVSILQYQFKHLMTPESYSRPPRTKSVLHIAYPRSFFQAEQTLCSYSFMERLQTSTIGRRYVGPVGGGYEEGRYSWIDALQLLIHGATANKYYWSALGPVGGGYEEGRYSWIDAAQAQGYHTITIDRLGVGNSSHPSPVYVRLPLEADITSKIVHQLRTKPLSVATFGSHPSKRFRKEIVVGHSIASVLVNYLILQEPEVADAVILTGYVHIFTKVNTSGQQIGPASSIFPQRFLGLDPGYQNYCVCRKHAGFIL